MTEPLPPLTDEDLSAVLDGEAGPEVVARVQADPAARARVDAFRAAGDALRQAPVDPLDAATVDHLIAGALASADGAGTADGAATADHDRGTDAVVTPLAPRRNNRGAPRWLVAAAIIALVAVGLGLVWSGVSNDGDSNLAQQTADQSGDSSEESDSGAGGGGDSGGAAIEPEAPDTEGTGGEGPQAVPTTTGESASEDTIPDVVDLGGFASFDALRTALRTTFPASATARENDGPSQEQIDRCDTQMRQVFEIADGPVNTGIATVADQEVIVFEYDRPSFADGRPTTFVTAVTPDACTAELSFERTPG